MNKLEGLQKMLDREKWTSVDVPHYFIVLIEKLHNPGSSTEFSDPSPLSESQQLISDEIKYWACESLLLLLHVMYEYVEFITNVRDVAFEGALGLVDLIKVISIT